MRLEYLNFLFSQILSHVSWTLGLPKGVLSNRPCPWSVGPSVFKYLRDRSKDFYNFLHEVHRGTKVTEPDFEKKSRRVTNEETPNFRGISEVFCPYPCF